MFGISSFEKALANVHLIIIDHKDVLIEHRKKLYPPDRYGIRDGIKWIRELTYFSDKVIDARLSSVEKALIRSTWKKNYLDELDGIVAHYQAQS